MLPMLDALLAHVQLPKPKRAKHLRGEKIQQGTSQLQENKIIVNNGVTTAEAKYDRLRGVHFYNFLSAISSGACLIIHGHNAMKINRDLHSHQWEQQIGSMSWVHVDHLSKYLPSFSKWTSQSTELDSRPNPKHGTSLEQSPGGVSPLVKFSLLSKYIFLVTFQINQYLHIVNYISCLEKLQI